MSNQITGIRTSKALALLFLLFAGMHAALADQVTLSYIDNNSDEQKLLLDCSSSNQDLALAASLMGEAGVSVAYDPDSGCGTLAELAAALSAAAPVFAPNIAQVLVTMSPLNKEAIVAAINAVPGVNKTAVLAAIHFGPISDIVGPQTIGSNSSANFQLIRSEPVPSRN